MDTNTLSLNKVGEEISHELGAKMIKDFQDQNPQEDIATFIGRDIIDRILSQPGCTGIRFYYAINELGKKTLVYIGVDSNDDLILDVPGVDKSGKVVAIPGIVADRSGEPCAPWHWNQD